jgi:glycerophosphoinositol glycerophosphodiesterase
VLDKQTLEKANIHKQVNKTSYDEIKNLNVADYHPLGKQFGQQAVLTLDSLLKMIETMNVVIILNVSRTNPAFVEKFKQAISAHEPMFTKKIVFCCRSPIIVYKVSQESFPFLN